MKAYRAFFQSLIDRLREDHNFTKARVAPLPNWYSFASGFSGIYYSLSFAQGGQVRAEVYIDRGDFDSNKELFDALAEAKDLVETEFEEMLNWERLDHRRACRVAVYRTESIEDDPQTIGEVEEWAIKRLLGLKKVFGPKLAEMVK